MKQIDLNNGINPEAVGHLISDSEYEQYRFNRINAPDIPLTSWYMIWGEKKVKEMEARYTAENN